MKTADCICRNAAAAAGAAVHLMSLVAMIKLRASVIDRARAARHTQLERAISAPERASHRRRTRRRTGDARIYTCITHRVHVYTVCTRTNVAATTIFCAEK